MASGFDRAQWAYDNALPPYLDNEAEDELDDDTDDEDV